MTKLESMKHVLIQVAKTFGWFLYLLENWREAFLTLNEAISALY